MQLCFASFALHPPSHDFIIYNRTFEQVKYLLQYLLLVRAVSYTLVYSTVRLRDSTEIEQILSIVRPSVYRKNYPAFRSCVPVSQLFDKTKDKDKTFPLGSSLRLYLGDKMMRCDR